MWARTTLVAGGVLLVAAGLSFGSSPKQAGARHGEILCGDSEKSKVFRLDPATGDKHVLSADNRLVNPNDLAFDGPNKLYVADYQAFDGGGGVFKIDPDTGRTTVVSKSKKFEQPDGIAAAPNGKLWVTDLEVDGGALFRVAPETGKTKKVGSGGDLGGALGVVVPPSGKPIVSSTPIVRVDPKTGNQHVIADAGDGLTGSGGLARASHGKLYVTDQSLLQSVNPRTGNVKTAVDPFGGDGYGMVADSKGRIYSQTNGDVIRGNPKNNNLDTVGEGFGYCEGFEFVR
jgi:sugar lactone lactonase YvrE